MSRFFMILRRFAPVALLCSPMPWIIGCGSDLTATNPVGQSPTLPFSSGTISGHLHGGNPPVSGSLVNLYAAGTSGYGSAGVLYASTTTSNDGTGSFTFNQTSPTTPTTGPSSTITNTYSCPTGSTTNPDPQMYMIARGGNTGSGNNSAAVFAVALGPCSGLASSFVDMNEVASVATMAALQQYFNPVNESFGYPSTTQAALGFANNVNLISNMVTVSNGTANTSITHSATPLGHGTLTGTSVTVTVTPEYNKINLIANILAACIDTTSSSSSVSPNCSTLFTNAVPPTAAFTSQPTQTFTAITSSNEDTLQALYFMMTNPTSGGALSTNATSNGTNITNLYGLANAQAVFQPYYSSAPTDWTVGINYKSTSSGTDTCVTQVGSGQPSGSSAPTTTTSTGTFLNDVISLAVDASGNIWGASNAISNGNLFEISPVGIPMTCGLGTLSAGVTAVTIDSAGYVWTDSTLEASSGQPTPVTDYYLYKWNPTGSLDSSWPTVITGTTASTTQAIAADGSGNVFYSMNDGGDRGVVEIVGGGVVAAAPGSTTQANLNPSINTRPYYMQVDSSGNVWVSDRNSDYEEFYPCSSGTGCTNGYKFVETTDSTNPYGVAIGQAPVAGIAGTTSVAAGTELVSLVGAGDWHQLQPDSPGIVTSLFTATEGIAGLNGPEGMAVDGASNLWAANTGSEAYNWVTGATNTKTTSAFSELSWNGENLSGTSTTTVSTTTTYGGGFQKDPTLIMPYGARGVAIDPSGNVWEGLYNGTGIVELVGQGVPVVTPLSTATSAGTLGAKP